VRLGSEAHQQVLDGFPRIEVATRIGQLNDQRAFTRLPSKSFQEGKQNDSIKQISSMSTKLK
jgi:hypothetical protein